jgi:predicted DNA-binding WGR domain protein
MKLIQQTCLYFQQGSSDKVYEVDMCEVGANQYVVNFRFGRRGTTLKEGTKTTAPVARAEADKIFNALVAEKTKKGYVPVGTPPPPPKPKVTINKNANPDAQPRNRWNYRTVTVNWDSFAGYYSFNCVLYANSPRYEFKPNSMAARCKANYRPGDPAPAAREEAFPKLWEAQPVGLLHLLSESNCLRVHEFTVKALADCQEFCEQLDIETVVMLLARPYEITARFGFELAKARYDAANPDRDLVSAVANSAFAEARTQAHRWIDAGRNHFVSDNQFLLALITSQYEDTREFARNLLVSSLLPDEQAKAFIAQLIAATFCCITKRLWMHCRRALSTRA